MYGPLLSDGLREVTYFFDPVLYPLIKEIVVSNSYEILWDLKIDLQIEDYSMEDQRYSILDSSKIHSFLFTLEKAFKV